MKTLGEGQEKMLEEVKKVGEGLEKLVASQDEANHLHSKMIASQDEANQHQAEHNALMRTLIKRLNNVKWR